MRGADSLPPLHLRWGHKVNHGLRNVYRGEIKLQQCKDKEEEGCKSLSSSRTGCHENEGETEGSCWPFRKCLKLKKMQSDK